MDTKRYYSDIRKLETELTERCNGNTVHITSVFNREKNSTEGATCSASAYNAARAIVDSTHRLATPEEVQSFARLQEKNRRESIDGEIRKRQQFVTVVNQKTEDSVQGLGDAAAEASAGDKKPKVAR